MPNQRAKNKLYLGGFVDKRLHALILRQARQAGMQHNKYGFVTQLLQEALKSRGAQPNGKVVRE
jgi:hypothetical protein